MTDQSVAFELLPALRACPAPLHRALLGSRGRAGTAVLRGAQLPPAATDSCQGLCTTRAVTVVHATPVAPGSTHADLTGRTRQTPGPVVPRKHGLRASAPALSKRRVREHARRLAVPAAPSRPSERARRSGLRLPSDSRRKRARCGARTAVPAGNVLLHTDALRRARAAQKDRTAVHCGCITCSVRASAAERRRGHRDTGWRVQAAGGEAARAILTQRRLESAQPGEPRAAQQRARLCRSGLTTEQSKPVRALRLVCPAVACVRSGWAQLPLVIPGSVRSRLLLGNACPPHMPRRRLIFWPGTLGMPQVWWGCCTRTCQTR